MTQTLTRHKRATGTEASPVERRSRAREGRRPRPPGNPRSSNSLLDGSPAFLDDRLLERAVDGAVWTRELIDFLQRHCRGVIGHASVPGTKLFVETRPVQELNLNHTGIVGDPKP